MATVKFDAEIVHLKIRAFHFAEPLLYGLALFIFFPVGPFSFFEDIALAFAYDGFAVHRDRRSSRHKILMLGFGSRGADAVRLFLFVFGISRANDRDALAFFHLHGFGQRMSVKACVFVFCFEVPDQLSFLRALGLFAEPVDLHARIAAGLLSSVTDRAELCFFTHLKYACCADLFI